MKFYAKEFVKTLFQQKLTEMQCVHLTQINFWFAMKKIACHEKRYFYDKPGRMEECFFSRWVIFEV